MKEIILATSNKDKLIELTSILSPTVCIPQNTLGISDIEETGLSFVENAIIKARHASRLSNKPALADDSGLVVEALNGAPGIYSARFSGSNALGDDNINLLLSKLSGVPKSQRQAYFYCAIVLVKHAKDPTPLIATGRLSGSISEERAGAYGFGYDPVFYLSEYNCTVAQLPIETKNTISHRAQALRELKKKLAE